MNKKFDKILFPIFVGELLSIISCFILTKKNDYFWIAIVVLAVVMIITSYLLFSNSFEFINTWLNENQNVNEAMKTRHNELYSSVIKKMDNNRVALSEQISSLITIEESLMQKYDEYCKSFSESVEKLRENNCHTISELKERIDSFTGNAEKLFIEISNKNEKQYSRMTDALSKHNESLINTNVSVLSELRTELATHINDLRENIKKFQENLEQTNNESQNKIDLITKIQKKNLDDHNFFVENIANIIEDIKNQNEKQIEKLSEIFIEHSNLMSSRNIAEISKVSSEISAGYTTLTQMYDQTLREISQKHSIQIEEWKSCTEHIVATCEEKIESVIKTVEENLNKNTDENSTVIKDNVEITRNLIDQIVEKTQTLLSNQLNKLERVYNELSSQTIDYTQKLMDKIQIISSNNITEISTKSENVMEGIAKRIEEENQHTTEKRIEAFEKYITDLESTYNSIISEHIEVLEEQIIKSINNFIDVNKNALENSNDLTTELIVSERSFVSEIETNNSKLCEIIDSAFKEYSKSVEKNITDMKTILAENINDSTKITRDRISDLVDKNEKTIDKLADKLKEHSDSLVEKSAIAIANVQADNNVKLQELCKQMAEYVSENTKFSEYCKELNDLLNKKIIQLIEDRSIFIEDLKTLSGEHTIDLDNKMQGRINDMINKLQNLNIENVSAFNNSMIDYRKKFVEANAKAISDVQKENVNSVSDAHKKIAELATNMKTFQVQIVEIVETLQSIISTGINDKKENDEKFDNNMQILFDEKLSEYDKKIQEYNDSFNQLGEKITEVMNACQINTEKYDETLRFIIETQKEANSLSSKDLELLEMFAKR